MKVVKIVLGTFALIAATVLLTFAAISGEQREQEYNKELNAHVIATWENAPEDFHGHDCEYGEWCTKSYYDFLKSKESK